MKMPISNGLRRFFSQMRRFFRRRRVSHASPIINHMGHGEIPPAGTTYRSHRHADYEELSELSEHDVYLDDSDIYAESLTEDVIIYQPEDVFFRRPKIELVVGHTIIPFGAGINYNSWTNSDILRWLWSFYPNEQIMDVIYNTNVTGEHLWLCFLNSETSSNFCHNNGISDGAALRVKMVLGRVHNLFYEHY
ncbi:ORF56 [Caenorhabditis elegans]|uniref:ORF56 n=1 Tax=Caenorhabditis elegans TaxID=6239 RepID=O16572_CAEEL|nr:ORF56 [Caenorhabditis elegans]CCD64925.2 ORF56 [Caenorhabditis elegans]